MNRFAYTFATTLFAPALLGWVGVRARRAGGRWGVLSAARFGHYTTAAPLARPIWIHTTSLGETRAAQPFIQALLDQGETIVLTHMTATGRAEGERLFGAALARGRLILQWLPYDLPWAVRGFFTHYRPLIGIMVEREIWPNLIAAAHRRHVPVMLVSARFSDHSLRQSLRLGRVMQQTFGLLARVYAQTLRDAQRLEQAGAVSVRVSGNFKFDVHVPETDVARGRAFAAALPRKIITLASTREGEDAAFIQAIARHIERSRSMGHHLGGQDLTEHVLFCIVPRHPQRFEAVAALLEQAALPYVRRTQFADGGGAVPSNLRLCAPAAVLLGDSLGELPIYYGASQIAIMGGSFAPLGGQNLIEACAVGVPVIIGPHTHNFEQATIDAIAAGAAVRVDSVEAALATALGWLDEAPRLQQMGEAGRYWVRQHAGAVARVVDGLNELKRAGVAADGAAPNLAGGKPR